MLSRAEAAEHGLVFSHEDDFRFAADPDQPHFFADLTIDGHTEHFQGKSEQDVLDSAEKVLIARGRIEVSSDVAERQPLVGQTLDNLPDVEEEFEDVTDDDDDFENEETKLVEA